MRQSQFSVEINKLSPALRKTVLLIEEKIPGGATVEDS
jgi:hypothetical protein